ncbi:uncharacterized protein LAJ45_02168 [Morchella importuna]|uniref:uncharacterized protein n=1 Tax=Morchella importuna TaxID=1174673 RepID=UPI001E8D71AA|nr:uncharacterized protein LAJ45_02168 [Morchella importuna]KAH8153356.1 hypothetical protein LAJ45_02168 [Morchella importuna]
MHLQQFRRTPDRSKTWGLSCTADQYLSNLIFEICTLIGSTSKRLLATIISSQHNLSQHLFPKARPTIKKL